MPRHFYCVLADLDIRSAVEMTRRNFHQRETASAIWMFLGLGGSCQACVDIRSYSSYLQRSYCVVQHVEVFYSYEVNKSDFHLDTINGEFVCLASQGRASVRSV